MSVPNQRFKPGLRAELITPDGETFELNTPPTRFVTGLVGFGMTPPQYNTRRSPYQHGERLISTKLGNRDVSLTLTNPGCSRDQYWGNRSQLIDYLRESRSALNDPIPSQLVLHYTEDGVYKDRALDVVFKDGAVFAEPDTGVWNKFNVVENITFTAYNPVVYDPNEITDSRSTFTASLILPFTFPFTLGTFLSTDTITYQGTWEEYPVIEIVGPAKNFSIINNTIDKRVDFWGEVASNETVTIDLRPGEKTVTNNFDEDLMHAIAGNLSTFSLQCSPIVTGGVNSISVFSEVYSPGKTTITLIYHNRYRGI